MLLLRDFDFVLKSFWDDVIVLRDVDCVMLLCVSDVTVHVVLGACNVGFEGRASDEALSGPVFSRMARETSISGGVLEVLV